MYEINLTRKAFLFCVCVKMNALLPHDIQWFIWRKVFRFVVKELSGGPQQGGRIPWQNPSDRLIDLCQDTGTIQQGHHELEDMIEDHNMWAYTLCVHGLCDNCVMYGFPCLNLASYGFNNPSLGGIWKANFTIG